METRILDRSNYSTKTIDNFEIISAYYVDIFYNHLYNEAKKLKISGSACSITEGYKHTLNAFIKSLDNPNLYKKSLSGMHHYFITVGFASISYSNFIDRITADFVPKDYFNSLTFTQKIGVLRMVLSQSIKSFIKNVVDSHMSKIIDYHKEQDNVRILQDDFIDCLIMEREGFYQRFVTDKVINKNDTVNRLVAEKMQAEIKKLIGEKYELKRQNNILKKAYLVKKASETSLLKTIEELKGSQYRRQEQRPETRQERPFYNREPMIREQLPVQRTDQQRPESMLREQRPESMLREQRPVHRPDQQRPESMLREQRPVQRPDQQRTESMLREPVKKIESESDSDAENESSYIEVNSSNINSIVNGDSVMLNALRSADDFNLTMEEGTTLDDF